MQIVPVLDLSNGVVVHAKKGDRINYQPIVSHLCTSSNPIEIISSFLDLYNFKCVYIADLDALQKLGDNIEIIESIYRQYPNLEIWLDTGISLIEHYLKNIKLNSLRLIVSTESIDSISTFISILDDFPTHNFVLSIDYIEGKNLGPNILNQSTLEIPNDIILLNLDNVGSNQGVDIPVNLNQQNLSNKINLYYGGGIRNYKDLIKLKTVGFTGALIASALHNAKITREDLNSISQ